MFRVMHCSRLTSMKGVSLFVNLRELNLSSNGLLSTSFLDGIKHIEVLNLSCNKLSQIGQNLVHFATTLRKLILSHNRLVSIQPLQIQSGYNPALEYLDLNDNYIGELDQIKFLQGYTNLRELIF